MRATNASISAGRDIRGRSRGGTQCTAEVVAVRGPLIGRAAPAQVERHAKDGLGADAVARAEGKLVMSREQRMRVDAMGRGPIPRSAPDRGDAGRVRRAHGDDARP